MKPLHRIVCRLSIISIGVLPYSANAGMIGTEQALAGAQPPGTSERARDLAARAKLTRELQTLGIPSSIAEGRVGAMTHEEVTELAGNVHRLPAAGVSRGSDKTWANRPL